MLKQFILAAGLCLIATSAASGPTPPGGVQVRDAWSRPAAVGTIGAGFFTITNSGPAPETLISVTSPLATRVELHQTSMNGGVMSMQRLESGVTLPPGKSVVFAPGGKHLMLFGLKSALKAGGSVPLTLNLASGGRLQAKAVVRLSPPPASPAK